MGHPWRLRRDPAVDSRATCSSENAIRTNAASLWIKWGCEEKVIRFLEVTKARNWLTELTATPQEKTGWPWKKDQPESKGWWSLYPLVGRTMSHRNWGYSLEMQHLAACTRLWGLIWQNNNFLEVGDAFIPFNFSFGTWMIISGPGRKLSRLAMQDQWPKIDPCNPCKKLDVVIVTCNPSAAILKCTAETGESPGSSQAG